MFPEDENGLRQTRTLPSSNSVSPIPDARGENASHFQAIRPNLIPNSNV